MNWNLQTLNDEYDSSNFDDVIDETVPFWENSNPDIKFPSLSKQQIAWFYPKYCVLTLFGNSKINGPFITTLFK